MDIDTAIYRFQPYIAKWGLMCLSSCPYWISLDDLMQVGRMGVVKAVRTYDSSRGAAFDTYALNCIRHAVVDEVRRLRGRRGHKRMEFPYGIGYHTHEMHVDLTQTDLGFAQRYQEELFAQCQLPKKLQRIWHLYFDMCLDATEICQRLHLTMETFRSYLSRARKAIRAEIEKENHASEIQSTTAMDCRMSA